MSTIEFKLVLIALALLAVAVVAVGLSGGPHRGEPANVPSQAQVQPSGPPQVQPQPQPQPRHPGGDVRNCLRCHTRPEALPKEAIALCSGCHNLKEAHRTAPRPAHPVKFPAQTRECYLCHNPHHGPGASDHAANGEARFCAACHLSHDGLPEEEKVEFTCAQCHNLGLPEGHPAGEDCERCHEEVLKALG